MTVRDLVRRIVDSQSASSEIPQLSRGDEVDDGVFSYYLSLDRSAIVFQSNFEFGGTGFWIMSVETDQEFRRQGFASKLMRRLYELASSTATKSHRQRATIYHGALTDDGEKMRRMIDRVATPVWQLIHT